VDKEQIFTLMDSLIEIGAYYHLRGFSLATSSNYSVKLEQGKYLITVSGRRKERLTRDDFLIVGEDSSPLKDDTILTIIPDNASKKPSAETMLHARLYRDFPERVSSVLHTHSPLAAVLSRRIGEGSIRFKGYEMQKAFPGVETHEGTVEVPVIPNSQDLKELSKNAAARLSQMPSAPFILIAGHGIYGWGKDIDEAERVMEAAEYLIDCYWHDMTNKEIV